MLKPLGAYVLVFDCESIPNVDLALKAYGLEPKDSFSENCESIFAARKEETKGQDFLPIALHHILCSSCALLDRSYNLLELFTLKGDEQGIVQDFFALINEKRPQLVGFNSKQFDIALLTLKALKYGVDASGYFHLGKNSYGYIDRWHNNYLKDSNFHIDLSKTLRFGSMDRICKALGIPGKLEVEGSGVVALYEEGLLQDIYDYCESDVINTLLLHYRYLLAARKIDLKRHKELLKSLKDFLTNFETKPYTQVFCDYCDKNNDEC